MRFVCEQCQARYTIPDDKVRGRALKVRCKKCGNVIIIKPVSGLVISAPAPAPTAADETILTTAQDMARLFEQAKSPPAASATEWFTIVKGKQEGPMSKAELLARVESGALNATSYVWSEELPDWKRLADVPSLTAKPQRPRPATRAPVEAPVAPAPAPVAARPRPATRAPVAAVPDTTPAARPRPATRAPFVAAPVPGIAAPPAAASGSAKSTLRERATRAQVLANAERVAADLEPVTAVLPVNRTIEPPPAAKPAPVAKPTQPAPVVKPAEPTPVAKPIQPAAVAKPSQPTPVAIPSAAVAKPGQPAPVAQTSGPASNPAHAALLEPVADEVTFEPIEPKAAKADPFASVPDSPDMVAPKGEEMGEFTRALIVKAGVTKRRSPLRIALFLGGALVLIGAGVFALSRLGASLPGGHVHAKADTKPTPTATVAVFPGATASDPNLRNQLLGAPAPASPDAGRAQSAEGPASTGRGPRGVVGALAHKDAQHVDKLDDASRAQLKNLYAAGIHDPTVNLPTQAQAQAPAIDRPDAPLTGQQVSATVAHYQGGFARCIDLELKRNPGFRGGKIRIVTTIMTSGLVRQAEIQSDDAALTHRLEGSPLGGCLIDQTRRMVFPNFSGDPFDAEIPLVLGSSL